MSLSDSSPRAPRLGIAMDLVLGVPVVAGVAATLGSALSLSGRFTLEALAMYAAVSLMILFRAPGRITDAGWNGLGPANRVTLARLLLIVPLGALTLYPTALQSTARWWIVSLGTLAMVLDGVDGWVARRTGTGSRFGARLDMESDAALVLLLSILVWQSGQAPAWVILMGAMRYLFVAAGWVEPALRGELPESMRRKVVCVVQGVTLLVALGPIVPPTLASFAVGAGLVLLAWSFGVDTVWLLRRRGHAVAQGLSPSGDG